MYCSNCGKKIVPEGASYCWNCGVSLDPGQPTWSQKGDEQPPMAEWESCSLRHSHTLDNIVPMLKAYITFIAEATGPTGAYTAATSQAFTINPSFSSPDLSPKPTDFGAKQALDAVVNKLLQEGWEQIGEGPAWFQRQFRRRVQ
jgi:hypothetical protein